MVWLPLRGHEIFIEPPNTVSQLSITANKKKNAWIAITAKLEEIWRSESHVNLNLKRWSRATFTLTMTHTFPTFNTHTHKYRINISGCCCSCCCPERLCWILFNKTLQHCQNIWININTLIYSRILPQLLTDRPLKFVREQTLWPFSHRAGVVNTSHPAPPRNLKISSISCCHLVHFFPRELGRSPLQQLGSHPTICWQITAYWIRKVERKWQKIKHKKSLKPPQYHKRSSW